MELLVLLFLENAYIFVTKVTYIFLLKKLCPPTHNQKCYPSSRPSLKAVFCLSDSVDMNNISSCLISLAKMGTLKPKVRLFLFIHTQEEVPNIFIIILRNWSFHFGHQLFKKSFLPLSIQWNIYILIICKAASKTVWFWIWNLLFSSHLCHLTTTKFPPLYYVMSSALSTLKSEVLFK